MAHEPHPFSSPPSAVEAETGSVASLISRLVGEFSMLFRQEIALAKAEISESASHAKAGAISIAAGGAVIFAALLVLLSAAVFALAHVMADWLAALVVGIVTAVIGFVLIQSGKKQLEPAALKLERTQDALRKDKEMVQRRTS